MTRLLGHTYGFHWGPFNVTRLCSVARGKGETTVLGVDTAHHAVEVASSRTGRSVRVWIDGVEVGR